MIDIPKLRSKSERNPARLRASWRKARSSPRMTVQELEKAIAKLSPEELAELRAWFLERDQDEWDRQIARDSEAGKLIQQAKRDYAGGERAGGVRHFAAASVSPKAHGHVTAR
jgi:hypothetical protein